MIANKPDRDHRPGPPRERSTAGSRGSRRAGSASIVIRPTASSDPLDSSAAMNRTGTSAYSGRMPVDPDEHEQEDRGEQRQEQRALVWRERRRDRLARRGAADALAAPRLLGVQERRRGCP